MRTMQNVMEVSDFKKVNLGSRTTRIPGFKNIDISHEGEVDLFLDASDLYLFNENQLDEIYASNILEHFSHTRTEDILKNWCGKLKPGGILWISVPDLDHIISTYSKSKYLAPWFINQLYGDQEYKEAYHYTIFNWPTLNNFLYQAGFSKVLKLQELPYLTNDCSHNRKNITGELVSLNAKAVK